MVHAVRLVTSILLQHIQSAACTHLFINCHILLSLPPLARTLRLQYSRQHKQKNKNSPSASILKAAETNEIHPIDTNLGRVFTHRIVTAFVGGFNQIDQVVQAEEIRIIER